MGADAAEAGAPTNSGTREDMTGMPENGEETEETAKSVPESGRGEGCSRGEERAAVAAESSKCDTGERKTVSESDILVAAPMGAGRQSRGSRFEGVKAPESGRGAPEAPTSFERELLPAKSNEFIVPYTIKQQRRSKIY